MREEPLVSPRASMCSDLGIVMFHYRFCEYKYTYFMPNFTKILAVQKIRYI
jgi:hypothetical protein